MGAPCYFEWDYHTIVQVGSGCRTFAPQRFIEMGAKRVAILTDPGIVKAGLLDMVKGIFEVQGQPRIVGIYDKIEQDASMRVINDCAEWCRIHAVDGILSLGGGSVLDTAKGVKFLLGMGETDIRTLMPGNAGPFIRPIGKPLGIPNVAIPTTAGTGAEVSQIAVIYNEEEKMKAILEHAYIAADYALLDPDLTLGLPPRMTAATGLDALCHAIEGLVSPTGNCMIDGLALHAIRLVLKYLPIAVKDGKNVEARTKLLVASNMAIMPFAMSGLIVPVHNIAHALGGQLRIPHGEAVAVCLPAVLKNFPYHFIGKAEDMAQAFGIRTDGMDDYSMVEAVRQKLLSLMDECNFKPYLDRSLDEASRKEMVKAVKGDISSLIYPIPSDTVAACMDDIFAKE